MDFVTIDIDSHDFSSEIPLSFQSTSAPPAIVMQEDGDEDSCGYRCGIGCKKCCEVHDIFITNSNRECPKCSLCCATEGMEYGLITASSCTGCLSSAMFFCDCPNSSTQFTPATITAITAGSLLALALLSFSSSATIYCCNKHLTKYTRSTCPNFSRAFDREK